MIDPNTVAIKAAKVEATKEYARRQLIHFTKYTWPHYETSKHNIFLADLWDKWAKGLYPRLIINTPPRHGKTQLFSRHGVAYLPGRYPGTQVLAVSNVQDMVNANSRAAKRLIKSPEYGEVFPNCSLSDDKQSQEEWETTNGSQFKAAGVGTTILGRGFNYGIIDDPIKGREDVATLTQRDNLDGWYKDEFAPRMLPNASILIVMTRFHRDDLAGRRLQSQGWKQINLPAIALKKDLLGRKVGEALWPDRYPIEWLLEQKGEIGINTFEAQYQGQPLAPGGTIFTRDMFNLIWSPPEGLRWFRFYDLAVSRTGNYTGSVKIARAEDSQYYIDGLIRVREPWPKLQKIIVNTALKEGPEVKIGIEDAGQQKGYVNELQVHDKLQGHTIVGYRPEGDKAMRADPVAAKGQAGLLNLVRQSLAETYLSEMEVFTGMDDPEDDLVDATSGAFLMTTNYASKFEVSDGKKKFRAHIGSVDLFGDDGFPSDRGTSGASGGFG